MRNHFRWICPLLIVVIACSCIGPQKSPKTGFTDGYYTRRINHEKRKVYVAIEADTLRIHNTTQVNKVVDTALAIHFYQHKTDDSAVSAYFDKYSFDIDFLTIPLKFRPAQKAAPAQLNTNLNGAGYFGYRTDRYHIRYATNPLGQAQRIINHYGFSIGGFVGIGNTAMTPTTTDNNIVIEYDGIVLGKGIAGIIAINNLTLGIAIGFDNLLDTNRKTWIYETKPWFGLAFGLNLN